MKINFKDSDKKLLLLFYSIAIPITLYGDYDNGWVEMVLDMIIYVVFSLTSLWFIVFFLFPKFLPERKMVLLLIYTTLFLIILGLIELQLYRGTTYLMRGTLSDWSKYSFWQIVLSALESSLENTGILLGMFLGKKFYDTQLDLQAREKEKRENELRILKSQIDPHFLFNNLNTVDSLIDSSPEAAKQYIRKLSNLYRYLIETKDDDVVQLEDELSFAENYTYLLEKRFGSAYRFEIIGKEQVRNQLIPPGALQTILENVIKHNSASQDKPVTAVIHIGANEIIVRNNYQAKRKRMKSTGIGLKNLRSRYRLLTDQKIEIVQGEDFEIRIPLIKNLE